MKKTKKKVINIFVLISSIFVFVISIITVNYISAQTMPPETIVVHLNYPVTGEGYTPQVSGQTNLTFRFSNINMDIFSRNVENFRINLYEDQSTAENNGANSIGHLFILENFQDTFDPYLWHFRVDTNDFQNNDYFITLSAFDSSVDQDYFFRQGLADLPFGPIYFNNQHSINYPQANAQLTGTTANITSRINGNAQNVIYNFFNSSNTLVHSIQINQPMSPSLNVTYWNAVFDTTKFENGQYSVNLSFTTLSGKFIQNFHRVSFIIYNENSVPQITPPICTEVCDDWSVCTTTGVQHRVCTVTTCTTEQTCTYVAPSPPVTEPSTDEPTPPANNTPPPVTEPSTDEPTPPANNTPVLVPKINMQYPEQGDIVSGDIILKAISDISIKSLEYLYKDINTKIQEFIGQAEISSNNNLLWQRIWNTDNIPTGKYYVYARALMSNGNSYFSNMIVINIDHENFNNQPIQPTETEQQFVLPAEEPTTDQDDDGVDDATEQILGTDPNQPNDTEEFSNLVDSAATDGKISSDKASRIKTGYVIDQPKNTKLLASSKIKVIKIENISPQIGKNNLVITGIGPANTNLKLYIYSDPIVVTTKTDASGNFTYTLDKNLLDGEHEVYVTINDGTGKITELSAPLSFFIRRAQAVTEEEYLRGDVNINTSSESVITKYVIPAAITVVALILIMIGVFMIKRKNNITP